MVKTSRGTRAEAELQRLASEAAGCQDCDLYRNATQTVFGRGPGNSGHWLVHLGRFRQVPRYLGGPEA